MFHGFDDAVRGPPDDTQARGDRIQSLVVK